MLPKLNPVETYSMREAWKIVLFILLIIGVLYLGKKITQWQDQEYTIASGKPGGGYEAFSEGVVELCTQKDLIQLSRLESAGSLDNLEKVISGEADFGLFQLSTPLSEDAAVVANIYEDYLHVLVRTDTEINSLLDLDGKKIFYGLDGSGTKIVSEQLLTHYGVKDIQRIESTPSESISLLKAGSLDAVIIVTAMHAPQIVEAIKSCEVKHLSFGDPYVPHNSAHGISQANTALNPAVIPMHTYGRADDKLTVLPESPISTLSVPSVLICHRDAKKELVQLLTKSIFQHRYFLTQFNIDAVNLKEPKSFHAFQFHAGAEQYYRRKDPSFLVVYAEVIAMILSVIIAIVGSLSALSKWISVRNKNRIDTYYVKVGESIKNLHDHKVDDLKAEEEKLYTLRQQAFSELVDERLSPDESFRIFQDLLEQAFEECHRQMNLCIDAKRDTDLTS